MKESYIIFRSEYVIGGENGAAPRRLCVVCWPGNPQPYSTHQLNTQTGALFSGQYFGHFDGAVRSYLTRCRGRHMGSDPLPG